MAKILFCVNSVIDVDDKSIDSFYVGFINSLISNGNGVYLFRANNFLQHSNSEQKLWSYIDEKKITTYIKSIEPDLIFTFNNNIYKGILQNTECPVIFHSSESLDFLQSIELIKQYESRYYYVYFSHMHLNQMVSGLNLDRSKAFVTYVSTDLKSRKLQYTTNISFIGCAYYLHDSIDRLYTSSLQKPQLQKKLVQVFSELERDSLSLKMPYLQDLRKSIPDNNMKVVLMDLLSRNTRLETLSALTDLGLSIYGKNWFSAFSAFPKVALSFKGAAFTSQQLSKIYNSSKLSINIPHIHSSTAFSWRVPEIMASNSVLVSRSGLDRVFGPKFKLPTFDNPYEARALCKKLLAEENLRQDLIQYSNEIIDKLCRFEHRLKELEQILSVKLFNTGSKGKLVYIDAKNYSKINTIENLVNVAVDVLPSKLILRLGETVKPIKCWIPQSIKRKYRRMKEQGVKS